MSKKIFYLLLIIRFVFPPLLFIYLHPLYAMSINEIIIDGMIAPHHIFKPLINKKLVKNSKRCHDIPLDTWGFMWSLLPILYKNNKYYYVFNKYRLFMVTLLIFRLIGILTVYKFNTMKYLLIFPNFYIGAYVAISLCDLLKINETSKINKIIILCMIISYAREIFLVKINQNISTPPECHLN